MELESQSNMSTSQDDSFLIEDDEHISHLFDDEILAKPRHPKLFLSVNLNSHEFDNHFLCSETIRYRQQTLLTCLLSLVALVLAWLQWNYIRPNVNNLNLKTNHLYISLAPNKHLLTSVKNTASTVRTENITKEVNIKEKINPLLSPDNSPTQTLESDITETNTQLQKSLESSNINLHQSIQAVIQDHTKETFELNNNVTQEDPAKASLSQRLTPFNKIMAKTLNTPETLRLNKPRFNNKITITTTSLPDGFGNTEKNYFMIGDSCYYSSPLSQDGFSPSPIVEKANCDMLFMKEKITRDSIIKK